MTDDIIKPNDLVFLILDEKRRWLIKAEPGKEFHTHKGTIPFDDIIGKSFGSVIFSKPFETQGYKFYLLKPLPSDYILYMARKTQIIYPEDAGLILMYSGIRPGSRIIEAGCGSGALTCILGSYVKPDGYVYSYDIREKSLKQAKRNISNANLTDIVSVNYGDIINDDLKLKNIDSVVLDMPQPWQAIERVKMYLRASGTLVSFSPTIEQVKKTTFALDANDFKEINTYELIKRRYQVKENATRPEVRMIGHTGYLTFARKVLDEENPYREKIPIKPQIIDMKDMPLRG